MEDNHDRIAPIRPGPYRHQDRMKALGDIDGGKPQPDGTARIIQPPHDQSFASVYASIQRQTQAMANIVSSQPSTTSERK